jgi:hypothetical protein
MENKTSMRIFQFPAVPHKLFKTNMFQPNREKTVETSSAFSFFTALDFDLLRQKAPKYNQFSREKSLHNLKNGLFTLSRDFLPFYQFSRDLCVNRSVNELTRSSCTQILVDQSSSNPFCEDIKGIIRCFSLATRDVGAERCNF